LNFLAAWLQRCQPYGLPLSLFSSRRQFDKAHTPLFGLKSGAAKKAEKRITRLKVVWILRNIVCDEQQ
jgi:hypothetical protein